MSDQELIHWIIFVLGFASGFAIGAVFAIWYELKARRINL